MPPPDARPVVTPPPQPDSAPPPDWRDEWLVALGELLVRLRAATDRRAVVRLTKLSERHPLTERQWLTLKADISATYVHLKQSRRLPPLPRPA